MNESSIEEILLDLVPELFPGRATERSPAPSVLVELARVAARLPGVTGAGVMWNLEGRFRHAAGTDGLIAGVQRLQEREQAGPCVDAFRTAATVTVDDLAAAQLWPAVAAAAGQSGMAAFAAVPATGQGGSDGVVAVWSGATEGWPPAHLAGLALLGDLAATRVARLDDYRLLTRTGDDLRHALQSRVVVEQAKGILAGRKGISVERALDMMRRYARGHNQTLRSVAGEVVAGRLAI